MPFEFFIALRYLRAKRKQTFISFITFISILGVILGVMALIVVLSVMSGFQTALREKILGTNAHVIVLNYEGYFKNYNELIDSIKKKEDVVDAAPFIITQVLLSSKERAYGVVLRGIDVEKQAKVTNLEKQIKSGRLADLNDNGRENNLLIGKELARNLNLYLGDNITVILPMGQMTPMGMIPKMLTFKVVGIFETGMFEYDSNLVYANLHSVQKLLEIGDTVTGIEVKVKDILKADIIGLEIQKMLGFPFKVRNWKEMNKNLFSALKLEKTALFIILLLIVLVAAFNIITTLVMLVMEKNKDIAILKSMGATHKSIGKIFILQGVIIGIVGTFIGGFLGVLISLNLHGIVSFIERTFKVELLARDVYFIDKFPSQVDSLDVFLVCLFSFLICFLATLYPARQASKMDPAEVLRYE
ncbi:MAG: lipoprotein-releasing ABC transporter permease subunit [Proteobacteria bacterium]|nr:lipoprotein-releasing ABC transporter permease subunit [Pseudomonadota bacterium]